jgi:archaellum component FlaC
MSESEIVKQLKELDAKIEKLDAKVKQLVIDMPSIITKKVGELLSYNLGEFEARIKTIEETIAKKRGSSSD